MYTLISIIHPALSSISPPPASLDEAYDADSLLCATGNLPVNSSCGALRWVLHNQNETKRNLGTGKAVSEVGLVRDGEARLKYFVVRVAAAEDMHFAPEVCMQLNV